MSKQPFTIRLSRTEPLPRRKVAHEELDRALVAEALRRSDGEVTEAAAYLGMPKSTFHELAVRLGELTPAGGEVAL